MRKKIECVVGVIAALLLGGEVGEARSVPGSAATPASHNFAGCLDVNLSNGWTTNVCSAAHVIVPAPVDSAGGKTVIATVVSSAQAGVICTSIGIGKTGTGGAVSNTVPAPVGSSSPQDLVMTGANVPSSGLLYVDCIVGTANSIVKIDFNQ